MSTVLKIKYNNYIDKLYSHNNTLVPYIYKDFELSKTNITYAICIIASNCY